MEFLKNPNMGRKISQGSRNLVPRVFAPLPPIVLHLCYYQYYVTSS